MVNWRRFLIQLGALTVLVIAAVVFSVAVAKADAPPPPEEPAVTDSCFRQDPECYIPQVECDNYVFVPRNPDGTWTCPEPQHQLPEEVIGRQVDCPDGSIGRVIDEELKTTCDSIQAGFADPPLSPEDSSFKTMLAYTAIAVALFLATVGTLHMIWRTTPELPNRSSH